MSTATGDEIERLRARNAGLRTEVEALREFMDALQALVEALDHPPADEEVMRALATGLHTALTVLDAEHGALLVLDEDSDELVAVLSAGAGDAEPWRRSPAGAGVAGWALRRREPVIANDAAADERFDAEADRPAGRAAHSLLVVPAIGGERAMGVFAIADKRGHGLFGDDDQVLVSLMGRFAGELLVRMQQRHAAA